MAWFFAKSYARAPPSLKRTSLILFITVAGFYTTNSVFSITAKTLGPVGISFVLYSLVAISLAVFMLILTIVICRTPQLIFLHPFKALRLSVLHTDTGIPLFTHTWAAGRDMVDASLFSGMLQGIGMFMHESMNRGSLEEVKVSQAVLIVRASEEHPVACVMVTRSSKALRGALDRFATRFVERYAGQLADSSNVGLYDRAAELVEEYFFFVPDFE